MMLHVKPGELVDILLKDVEVVTAGSPSLEVLYRVGARREAHALYINPDSPNLVVTRIAPAEWPPQIGDVWADAHGGEWWCRPENQDDDAEAYLQSQKGGVDDPAWVLRQHGPMTLVYRKGWTPTPAADDDQAEPEQVDERAQLVAFLRELADLYEGNLSMPLPDGDCFNQIDMTQYADYREDVAASMAAIRATADALGVELVPVDAKSGKRHWRVERAFAGQRLRFVYVEDNPTPDVAPPGNAVAAEVAAEAATAPTFELGKAGEHYMASGTKGDEPGDCGAECVCGVGFYGFDSIGEAVEHLDRHIADPDPRDAVDPFHVLPDNTVHSAAPADDVSIAVTGAEDVADLMPELATLGAPEDLPEQRKLCGSCDAGLPMACTCPAPAEEA